MLLPGPSNLESYSLCQQDPGAGTECLMLPALSVNSRRVWHWFPLDSLLPKAPFSAVTWVFGKKLLTCCQSWGWKQKHHQSHKSRGETSICFGGEGDCFRVSLESVPASRVIKVKGSRHSDRCLADGEAGGKRRCFV